LCRKYIALIGLCLGLFFFSACSPFVASKQQPRPITIKYATWGSDEEIALTKKIIKQFESSHPTIKVDLLHIPDQYYQKIHLLMAADLAPDVLLCNNLQLPVYANAGQLRNISPMLTAGDTEPFFPQALRALTPVLRNKEANLATQPLYALPRDLSVVVVFYNKGLFQKAGVKVPSAGWTWANLLAKAKQLTNRQHHQFGVSFYQTPPLFWLPFLWSAIPDAGYSTGKASGELGANGRFLGQLTPVGLQSGLQGLQTYADYRNRWHVAPSQADSGNATMTQLFLQQHVAMLVSGPWVLPVIQKQHDFDWDMVAFPAGVAGSRVGLDATGLAMSASTPHPNEALALMQFITNETSLSQLAQAGLIIPARRAVFSALLTNPAFKQQATVYQQAINTGIPTQTPPLWNEMSEVWTQAMNPVWEGRQSATTAMDEARPALEALLTP
jgi:multiple sugar transport system substrate-binding protein